MSGREGTVSGREEEEEGGRAKFHITWGSFLSGPLPISVTVSVPHLLSLSTPTVQAIRCMSLIAWTS